jgi:TIR domain
MKRVFVSYSRNNLDVVNQLVQDMHAVGVQAWHDQTLTGGQRWWDNILANIRECDVFVFALSPESWESEACRSELAYVGHFGKPVLPVLVADGINLNLLPPPINEIQVTDYRRRDKEAAFALIKSISTAPGAPPLPDPLPTPPKVPVSYLSTLKERIDAPGPLSAQEQIALVFDLEVAVREGRSAAEMRDLLLSLRRRDDLLAKVGSRIDETLKAVEAKASSAAASRPRRVEEPTLCHQCRKAVDAGAKFCGNCGASIGAHAAPPPSGPGPVPPPVLQPSAWKVANSQTRRYACGQDDVPKVIVEVKNWLDTEGFDSQQMNTDDNGVLLQIKKRGSWRDFVGMATSLNIVFREADGLLTVEIGAGKWIDKAAVGTVSMFILWPLAVTAGFGAWEQMKMPDKIFGFIGNRLAYR